MISARLLAAFANSYPDAAYIQIGASDGVTLDPIASTARRLGWRGVLVEPSPRAFESLRDNYEGEDRVELVNAAISSEPGSRPFYFVDPEPGQEVPWWAQAIGSFDRDHLTRHLDADLHPSISQTEVDCLSFEQLLEVGGISSPDLVVIDTEGHDQEILAAIDLDRARPRMLVFEHEHIPADLRVELEERLREAGYEPVADGLDTWCLDVRPADELSRAWREIADTARPIFACAARADYLEHCRVMIESLRAQHPQGIEVHFLGGADVIPGPAEALEGIDGVITELHLIEEGALPELKTTSTFPISHWYRVLLPLVLPEIERVIYLDADTIAVAPLDELWQMPLEDELVAAVANPFPDSTTATAHREALGISEGRDYFNSGVMLLDLEGMRREAIPAKVIDYAAANPERLFLPEQDAMNAILRGRWKPLHPRWNSMNGLLALTGAAGLYPEGEAEEAVRNPAIRHFEGSGPNKPWHPDCKLPGADLYRRHHENIARR